MLCVKSLGEWTQGGCDILCGLLLALCLLGAHEDAPDRMGLPQFTDEPNVKVRLCLWNGADHVWTSLILDLQLSLEQTCAIQR